MVDSIQVCVKIEKFCVGSVVHLDEKCSLRTGAHPTPNFELV